MSENIKSKNKLKGDFGESSVDRYLNQSGYEVLGRNFKCRFGEIDIIFQDCDEIVFAEVKTRRGVEYGFPAEAVTYFKKKHIVNTAKYFLHTRNILNKNIRFDVIEVYLKNNGKIFINHIKSVFW